MLIVINTFFYNDSISSPNVSSPTPSVLSPFLVISCGYQFVIYPFLLHRRFYNDKTHLRCMCVCVLWGQCLVENTKARILLLYLEKQSVYFWRTRHEPMSSTTYNRIYIYTYTYTYTYTLILVVASFLFQFVSLSLLPIELKL